MSQENPDIRKQVEASRGPQKRLELLIPGLRSYRKLEDVRVADNLLRNQVADRLDRAKSNLEGVRNQMATSGDYTSLTSVASLISRVQQLGGEVRHAEQGYSGFVATISMNEQRLNQLYDFDNDFVNAAFSLLAQTEPPALAYDPTAPASVQTGIRNVGAAVDEFKQKWANRMEAVKGILVKG